MTLLDKEGYPTEELLQYIEEYYGEPGILEFISIIFSSWYHGDYGYKLHRPYKGRRKLELHTLGWSGNEDIIEAILSNIYLTHVLMKYYKWEAGGHYYFEIKERDK